MSKFDGRFWWTSPSFGENTVAVRLSDSANDATETAGSLGTLFLRRNPGEDSDQTRNLFKLPPAPIKHPGTFPKYIIYIWRISSPLNGRIVDLQKGPFRSGWESDAQLASCSTGSTSLGLESGFWVIVFTGPPRKHEKTWENMEVSINGGYPLKHPFPDGIVHDKNQPFWIPPWLWKPPHQKASALLWRA